MPVKGLSSDIAASEAKQWADEDDLHTLSRAHEIAEDPVRHGRVRKLASKKAHLFRRISGKRGMQTRK